MTKYILVIVRCLHLGSCLLIFGFCFFDCFLISPLKQLSDLYRSYHRIFRLALAFLWPLALISGIGWFILVTMEMSELGFLEILHNNLIRSVLSQTNFGRIWSIHLSVGLAAAAVAFSQRRTGNDILKANRSPYINLILNAHFLASLAFTGHALVGTRSIVVWHLLADLLHLLLVGIWPVGLIPLFYLLNYCRKTLCFCEELKQLIRRFSLVSLFAVGMLTATGLVNSWILVGNWPSLFHSPYEQLLLSKVLCFVAAIAFGAHNLLRLKPHLVNESVTLQSPTFVTLERNLKFELGLSAAILLIVSILGMISPPHQ